ncbi:MAG: His/Gly/Thr/Pro-type tRNA ligase C-terminal domain-containing protein, partial [Thermodesulfobacteriota bacterium]|nr:His/Gly/Thr/Pro-type tRNA ligase C-terminal domain-containing protein [Thermodesulfobacteriota bacterium]
MGVPLRIELGPRDVEKGQVVIARRDTGEKTPITENNLEESLAHTLSHIQSSLFDKAQKFLENNTHNIEDYHTFKALLESESGFFSCHFCESNVCEERIKEEAKATVRCIPFRETEDTGTCFICGNDSRKRVIVARSY